MQEESNQAEGLMVLIDLHCISFPTMWVNGDQQLFGFKII